MPEDRLKYLGARIHNARKACDLTQQESYEILFPIVNRLGLTTSDLFNVEPDQQEEEINRFLGKFRACNRSNQLLLLETLDFLAEKLLVRQNKEEDRME